MRSRGRPKRHINWPELGEFTTLEVRQNSKAKLSSGLIHIKIKEAIALGQIELVGKISSLSKGRPRNIYRKIK